MAQTDARPGFRLPWSSDRQSTDTPDGEQTTDPQAATTGWPSEDAAAAATSAPETAPAATDAATDAAPAAAAESAAVDPWATPSSASTEPAAAPAPPRPGKKPTKFMADLTKAMQAAAEDAKARALSQLQADAKTHVETIHGRSSTEAANLRRAADDDVAAVREWSKAEIARVREETESKITERKARLETEIENHAGVIEREIDAVQKTVAAYEDEMAAFFERLLGEEDPSRFATMAENLPEAPTFDDIVGGPAPVETEPVAAAVEAEAVAEPVTDTVEPAAGEAETTSTDTEAEAEATIGEIDVIEDAAADPVTAEAAADTAETAAAEDAATGEAETIASDETATEPATGTVEGVAGAATQGGEGDGEIDREAAFAAIQAAAEAAASAEVAADAAARAEAVADVAIEIIGNHEDEAEADPRFAALGLSPDFDAAEAEALAAAGTSDEEIPEIADDALAARLAGLVPGKGKGAATGETAASQVVVVGLVSVASIASFKRHLGRLAGVQSVGVSSGPDGEFIFAVNHAADVVLREVIPSLPSFQARVTGSSDGVIHVTAHDPEADA